MSRLAGAASPYLRSHADQPVNWYPWGEDAFAAARDRDVPVLISIGYSTCHWCHVMARESFADTATAEILNANFVAIKVDREEHPDVDAAFMAQASAFTSNLGWPLNVFTLPNGSAFFAGTYWPPQPRAGMPAFADVLLAIANAWRDRRESLEETGDAVRGALTRLAQPTTGDEVTAADVAAAARAIIAHEDAEYGGFGTTGPKFPIATVLGFLLAPGVDDLAPGSRDVGTFTLRSMRASELFDAVDGGFFRHATERDWSVPHYERMLVDNAQLMDVALAADDVATAEHIAAFLRDVLLQPSGGFGAAQDAESIIDGVASEGGYYRLPIDGRAEQSAPRVDEKVITGWNGLAMAALARLAQRTGNTEWLDLAQDAAVAVMQQNRTERGWVRASLDDITSRAGATTADLAQLAGGLLALALATGSVAYATAARDLVDELRDGTAPRDVPGDPVLRELGVPPTPDSGDGDEPSAHAALAHAALTLANLGAGSEYRELAETVVRQRWARAAASPLASGSTLSVAAALVRPAAQLVVVAPNPEVPLAQAARALPADVTAIVTPQQAQAFTDAGFALFAGKTAPALYRCENFTCALPITDVSQLG